MILGISWSLVVGVLLTLLGLVVITWVIFAVSALLLQRKIAKEVFRDESRYFPPRGPRI